MHATADAITWAALLVALAAAAVAGWRLRRGNPSGGRRDRELAMLLFGLVVLLNAVPRLAGASSGVTLVFSTIALLPLVGFAVLLVRSARA